MKSNEKFLNSNKFRLIRFGIVGLVTAILYGGVYLFFLKIFNAKYAIYFAYLIVLPINFFGHRNLTFVSRESLTPQIVKFVITQSAIVLSLGFLSEISHTFGSYSEIKLLLITVFVIPFLSYFIHVNWTFFSAKL